jgi:hypothetical protein
VQKINCTFVPLKYCVVVSPAFARTVALLLASVIIISCGKKTLAIDDAHEPQTLTLRSSEEVKAIDIEITGLLSGYARILFYRPDQPAEPWKIIELKPVIVRGIPMGIEPAIINSEYNQKEIELRYEPGRKMTGNLEIAYKFHAK